MLDQSNCGRPKVASDFSHMRSSTGCEREVVCESIPCKLARESRSGCSTFFSAHVESNDSSLLRRLCW